MRSGKYVVAVMLAFVGGCAARMSTPPPPIAPPQNGHADASVGSEAAPGGDGPDLTPAPNTLLEDVQAALHRIRSLEADFVEVISKVKGKNTTFETFEGHLAAKEPNHVIWVVEKPSRIAVRVFGEDLRIWTVDVMGKGGIQVINLAGNRTYKSMAEQTRDWAGGNFKKLAESYEVFRERERPGEALTLRFVPKSRTGLNSIFKSVSVTLTDRYESIQEIIYRKTDGAVYKLTLTNVKVNEMIPSRVWEIPPR